MKASSDPGAGVCPYGLGISEFRERERERERCFDGSLTHTPGARPSQCRAHPTGLRVEVMRRSWGAGARGLPVQLQRLDTELARSTCTPSLFLRGSTGVFLPIHAVLKGMTVTFFFEKGDIPYLHGSPLYY